jgi:hypothetical protein
MGALRVTGVVVLMALAGCGGGDSPPQLADGSTAASVPAELAELEDAVLTRTEVKNESDLDRDEYEACPVPRDSGDRTVVERTGVHGSSLTIESGYLLFGCDEIPDPDTVVDPDRPYDGIWCGSGTGRLDDGKLNDPRLSLCQNTDGEIRAFVWVEPQAGTKWVVVSDAGKREIYEVAEGLPVRVMTTKNIDPVGRASFAIEEYAADGAKLREYVLDAQVAG